MIKLDSDNTDPDVRIELVPLIDVIFCILTFFILAAVTLTRQAAINVDLPSAKTGTTQMRKILVVSVDPIGQTYVEKTPVTQAQLTDALVKFRKESPEGQMVLYASRASSYNDVVRVLDLLRSVGGNRVALATLPGGGQGDPIPGSGFPSGTGGQLTPISPSTLPGLSNPGSSSGSTFPLPSGSGGTGTGDALSPSSLPGLSPANPSGAGSLPLPSGTGSGAGTGSGVGTGSGAGTGTAPGQLPNSGQ
jgi:biopolymer transport protein ExbD